MIQRIDAEWLDDVITRLESNRALLPTLKVARNNLAFVRDGRLVVGCQPSARITDHAQPAEVSIRYTLPVRTVWKHAETPITAGDLATLLTDEFQDQQAETITQMLDTLVSQRFLITNLHPPMTEIDPLGHVLTALNAARADEIAELHALMKQIRDTHDDLTRARTSGSPALSTGSCRARNSSVDLLLDGGIAVPHAVAREAERAATALVRLTPNPLGTAAWRDYHHRFLERFGPVALVPISELVDLDSGLGYPAGYRGSRLTVRRDFLSARDERLLVLAQTAALQRVIEVALDDSMIADLGAGVVEATPVQPHTELRCRVHATSLDRLDRGQFDLAVTGASRAIGTVTGASSICSHPPTGGASFALSRTFRPSPPRR